MIELLVLAVAGILLYTALKSEKFLWLKCLLVSLTIFGGCFWASKIRIKNGPTVHAVVKTFVVYQNLDYCEDFGYCFFDQPISMHFEAKDLPKASKLIAIDYNKKYFKYFGIKFYIQDEILKLYSN